MSRKLVRDNPEPDKVKLKELRLPELKYLQEQLKEHYQLYPDIYDFLVRNDDRDLSGRNRKSIQSIVIFYRLNSNNSFNLTIDIDFSKIFYIEDILKRIILEIDNSLVKKEYKLKEFQYKNYKEPLLIGKKFIEEKDKIDIFYNPVEKSSLKDK